MFVLDKIVGSYVLFVAKAIRKELLLMGRRVTLTKQPESDLQSVRYSDLIYLANISCSTR